MYTCFIKSVYLQPIHIFRISLPLSPALPLSLSRSDVVAIVIVAVAVYFPTTNRI